MNIMSTNGTELPIYVQCMLAIFITLMWAAKNMMSLKNQCILAVLSAIILMISTVLIQMVLVLLSSQLSSV